MTAGSGVVLEADYWEMDANSTLYGVGCGYPAGLGPGAGVSPAFDLFPGGTDLSHSDSARRERG